MPSRSPSTYLKILLVAIAMVLIALAPSSSGAVTGRGTSTAVTKAATVVAKGAGTYRCTKWRAQGGVSTRSCAKITDFEQNFDVDYTRTFHNAFKKKTITVQCSTSKTTTWTFGVSATVEAEAGVIFAKAKTSITGSLERSAATTDTASATFKLKPGKYAHCKRGMYEYHWSGVVKRQACHPSQGCHTTRKHYTAHAPTRDGFFIGPGRG